MRIIVCIKQVPLVWAMKIDPDSKTLKREGVPTEVSSFDLRALNKAVEVARVHGGTVVVLTMGPPQARKALEECLAAGADSAIHLCDRAFAGSDTLATARALAAAIGREPFDLVLCGRYSVDAETGQVGPEVAELLGIPQITAARTLDLDVSARRLRAERETDEGFETVETSLPALVTAAEDLAPEPVPSKEDRASAKEKPVVTLEASQLQVEASRLGQQGSPTWVVGLEAVPSKRLGQVLTGESVGDAVDALVGVLLEHGLFGEWKSEAPVHQTTGAAVSRVGAADVWVFAEMLEGRLRPVTHELLSKGAQLAERLGSSLYAVSLGDGVERCVEEMGRYGASHVLLADDVRLKTYDTDLYTAILADAIARRAPGMVLLPSSVIGRDLAPRVAARLSLGLTGDCLDLDLDSEGRLLQIKPAFGGSIVAPILSKTTPEMATVRAGILEPQPRESGVRPSVERLGIPDLGAPRVRVLYSSTTAKTATALDEAKVVIGVGKGIGGPEQITAVEPLSRVLDAAICATRDVTDEGWLPKQYQVGFTGRSIAPHLYVAIGVRGAVYHMVGVRRAGLIVAINNNAKASIFKAADYGIVGNYEDVVPLLTAKLQRAKERAGV